MSSLSSRRRLPIRRSVESRPAFSRSTPMAPLSFAVLGWSANNGVRRHLDLIPADAGNVRFRTKFRECATSYVMKLAHPLRAPQGAGHPVCPTQRIQPRSRCLPRRRSDPETSHLNRAGCRHRAAASPRRGGHMSSLINHLAKTDDRIGELTQRIELYRIRVARTSKNPALAEQAHQLLPAMRAELAELTRIASASLVRLRLTRHYLLRPNLSGVAVLSFRAICVSRARNHNRLAVHPLRESIASARRYHGRRNRN